MRMLASKNVCEENHGNVVWHGKTEKTIKKKITKKEVHLQRILSCFFIAWIEEVKVYLNINEQFKCHRNKIIEKKISLL